MYSPSIAGSENEFNFVRRGSLPHSTIPIRLVVTPSESESGYSFVTPQQRRRPSHATTHYPHRQHRKVSAPPELQAHLGSFNTVIQHQATKGGANPDPAEPTEFIINLNNTNKLGLPSSEGLHSGSDSGVPSEYSSWAPVSSHYNSISPYEDIQTRSISGSLEDIRSSASLSDTHDDMHSPPNNHKDLHTPQATNSHTEGDQGNRTNNPENSQNPTPLVLAVNNPPPLNRSNTDTTLLNGPLSLQPQPRHRTNSMVFQLNLGNALQQSGSSNTLPANARSVSMFSLNTAGQAPTTTQYPNLSAINVDTQSIYSDAGAPAHFTPGLMRSHLSPNMGSQGSLSGMGYSGNVNYPQNNFEESNEVLVEMDESSKHKWLYDTLSKNLSMMYAILLFMIGIVLYSADTFSKNDAAMGEAFNVYLIVVQLIWFIYIHIDIRRYVFKISEALEDAREKDGKGEPVKLEPTADGQYQIRINLPEPKKTFAQHYGFTSGRHGGSLYLKIGAAVFCLGHLIHSGLNLGQKILYLLEEDERYASCTCFQDVLMSVLQPIYCFYQLFFIFKYSNLIINRRKRLSRFALMHCISASFLFWAYSILQETLLSIHNKNMKKYEKYGYNMSMLGYSTVTGDEDDLSAEEAEDVVASYSKPGATEYHINYGCNMDKPLTKMINDTTPYLFPFTIEYNILIVGVWILLWENIGRIDRHTHLPSVEMTYEDDNTKGIESNLIIYVDCHSSNRGLFAGLFVTVATVISIILFFIFTSEKTTVDHGVTVNAVSEVLLLAVMTVTALLGYFSIKNLDIMKHGVSYVDDIMLYICLPCIFLYSVFSMVPAIVKEPGDRHKEDIYIAIVSIAQIIQSVVQTALICDGLRRCSNSDRLTTRKPGRELITFLVVANVAMWLLQTFEIKSVAGNTLKYDFYGEKMWTLLSHLTLPLALFYRFHSSVCLVDIWKAGYEPEPEH